jgi:hypothetical protein
MIRDYRVFVASLRLDLQSKCVICGGIGVADAFYCYECTALEKDRDGCPKIGML